MALLECPHCHEMIHAASSEVEALARSKPAVRLASRNRPHFHRPGCQWADEIHDWNLLVFDDREGAIQAGLRPCKTCCS